MHQPLPANISLINTLSLSFQGAVRLGGTCLWRSSGGDAPGLVQQSSASEQAAPATYRVCYIPQVRSCVHDKSMPAGSICAPPSVVPFDSISDQVCQRECAHPRLNNTSPHHKNSQEEVLVPTCTVGESVVFASCMAAAGREAWQTKGAAEELVQRLGLAELWHTKVCVGVKTDTHVQSRAKICGQCLFFTTHTSAEPLSACATLCLAGGRTPGRRHSPEGHQRRREEGALLLLLLIAAE